MKLCINLRHEIRLIELDQIVYIKASGNYSDFHFVNGTIRSELSCLSDYEQTISRLYSSSANNPFLRFGRSFLLNTSFVSAVNVNRQTVSFSVESVPPIRLSKMASRQLKDLLACKFQESVHLSKAAISDNKPYGSDNQQQLEL